MTPFEQHLQALADLWNQGGNAYLTAQQSMFTGMADTMAKASSVGDKATFQAAGYEGLRGGAAGLLQAMVVGLRTLGRSDQEPARGRSGEPARRQHASQNLRSPRLVLGHERSRSDASAHGGGAAPRRPVERRAQVHRCVQRLGGPAPAQPRAQQSHAGSLDESGRRVCQDAE